MRNSILTGLLGVATIGGLSACDSFVQDVDGPIDRVVSDSLNQPSQVDFLVTGVKEGFNDSYDAAAVIADLLSDAALFNTDVDGATFPTFNDIDDGNIEPDNNTVDGVYGAINEYRYLADDLLNRLENEIEFEEDQAELRQSGYFAANFHGGVARYMLAAYFGDAPISTDPDNPAAPTPQAELYQMAQEKLAEAATSAATDYETRLVNTMRARIALFQGDYAQAASFAADGFVEGDPAYLGEYASTSQNNWWTQAGRGRTQVAVDDRFADYDVEDNRDLTEETPTVEGVTRTYYRQALYPNNSDPIPFLTWQENALIQAEAAIRSGNAGQARALLNAVRQSHGISDLGASDAVDLQRLFIERDRELFTRGIRLIDQRRAPVANQIPGATALPNEGFFPLTQTERNANPNV